MKNKCKHKQWSAWNSITTNPILWKDNIRMCEKCYHWYQLKTDCTFTQEEIDKRILEYPMKNKEACSNWEKEFEKFVPIKPGFSELKDYTKILDGTTANYLTLKNFISSLLEEKDREWKEKIKGELTKKEITDLLDKERE